MTPSIFILRMNWNIMIPCHTDLKNVSNKIFATIDRIEKYLSKKFENNETQSNDQ